MKFYSDILKHLSVLIDRNNRKRGIWIILLMTFNAILDFFSLASFFPLLFAIIDPKFITENQYASALYHFLKLSSASSFILVLTGGMLLFVLIKNLVSAWIVKLKTRYAFTFSRQLSSNLLMRYMSNGFLEFVKLDYAYQINIIANYPLTFANNIIIALTTVISEILVCLLVVACVIWYDYKVLFLILLIACPSFIFFSFRKKNLKKINDDIKEVYPLTLKYATEVVEGFPEIKAYGKELHFYQRFQKASKRLSEIFIKDQLVETGTVRLTEIIAACSICLLIVNAVIREQHHQQTLTLLSVYAAASFRIIPSVNRILQALQKIRTHEYLFEGLKPSTGSEQGLATYTSLTFKETAVFRNVTFGYPNHLVILNNISMAIRKGEKIAITGNSGEGKTTLLLVLLGFLPVTGDLIVDGKIVKHTGSWRKLISYVPQKPYILDGSVTENIAFGVARQDIDNAKILSLIKDLDLQELITQLPNGVDTRIGERGARLSGGQLQRLAIARALYADTDILVLDEVTNQVHDSLELEILSLLDRFADKKKTIIMVTHKVVSKNFFDTVYTLEKGALHKAISD